MAHPAAGAGAGWCAEAPGDGGSGLCAAQTGLAAGAGQSGHPGAHHPLPLS